uniref:Venom protein n=1 Tax=Ampulex compressa TaxID=860918 RepID=A0A1W6EWC0_AMPCP|nr:venom protein [Ampulex compressa]
MFGTLRIVRWILFFIVCSAWCQDCREKGWEKIGGTRPEFIGSSTALFSAIDSTGIVVPCFDRCLRTNCTAFVIDFERSVCYSVEIASEELASEPNSTFYHQICVKVPPLCKDQRLWQVERTPGAVLIDSTSTELPLAIPRSQCYQECMRAGDGCKSAQFQTTKPLSTEDSVGRCSLSAVERGTRPQAYRASIYRDEYLQDQCHNVSKQDYCSFAEFRNVTLPYSEISLPGLDIEQCEQRCDLGVDRFICRSYTVVYSAEGPDCLLHSEDTTSLGVSSLLPAPNAIYKEREPCLDLKVRCDHSMLTVTLTTKEPFIGRIYASGYSDACGVDGTARNQTVLSIALPKREDLSTTKIDCGLVPAFSIDEFNRTHALVWATIVIQFNPIIQRLGDQAVRVGCSLDDQDVPQPRNVSVQSSFSFLDPKSAAYSVHSREHFRRIAGGDHENPRRGAEGRGGDSAGPEARS